MSRQKAIVGSADVEVADLVTQQGAHDHGEHVRLLVRVEMVERFEPQPQARCFGDSFVGVEQERVGAGVER